MPAFLGANELGGGVIIDDHDLRAEILAPRELGEIPLAQGGCICVQKPLADDADPSQPKSILAREDDFDRERL